MMTTRITKLGIDVLLCASVGTVAGAQVGTVLSHQKISDLEGNLGAALSNGDGFGSAHASLGDLDGDGVRDLCVGAAGDDSGGADRGAVYVLFMNADGTVGSGSKIAHGIGGLSGALSDGDHFGAELEFLGDLDGNGQPEIAVSAPGDDGGGSDRGAVWILSLSASGAVVAETRIGDGAGGFPAAQLDDGDEFGTTLALIGDLDGDGVPEIGVGVPFDDDGGTLGTASEVGAVWVLFLNPGGSVATAQKISASLGNFGGSLEDGDEFGQVTPLGDLDADGVRDLGVGAPGDDDGATDAGAFWVLFLANNGTVQSEAKVSATVGGFGGVLAAGDRFGLAGDFLGDIDGDGAGDVVVASLDDDGGIDAGALWILFPAEDGTLKSHRKISASQGGFSGTLDAGDRFGTKPAFLRDLDGDGLGDLVVGAEGDDDGGAERGASYVLFLETAPLVAVGRAQKLSALEGGVTGLEAGDGFGSVARIGDFDGDGIEDLAVGAPGDDDLGPDAGAIRLLYLNADGTVKAATKITIAGLPFLGNYITNLGDLDGDGTIDLASALSIEDVAIIFLNANGTVKSSLRVGQNGFSVPVGDFFVQSVACIGDVDGDGVQDLGIGTPAYFDDDGAIWILFMNTNGTIKGSQQLGVEAGVLDNIEFADDCLGIGLAALGDLDGDSIPDIAVGGRSSASRMGNHIFYLNADGTPKDSRVIHNSNAEDDHFSLEAAIGDLDGDGVVDLVAGASWDDDGGAPGSSRGAAWFVFLNVDGTVKAFQKVSGTLGGLGGNLEESAFFGEVLAPLGDLDGDGILDLAVSARGDGDGGVEAGAAWILSLESLRTLSPKSVWAGSVDTSWADPNNWIGPVPASETDALVPPDPIGGVDPDATGLSHSCHSLVIQENASLTIGATFDVYGDVLVEGDLLGSGALQLRGSGTVSAPGATSLTNPSVVRVDTAGAVTFGDSVTISSLEVLQGSLLIESSEAAPTNVLGTTNLASGTLGGSGCLDLDGDATIELTAGVPGPTVRASADLLIDSSTFAPSAGRILCDGVALQQVTQLGGAIPTLFFGLEIAAGADVDVLSPLEVDGQLLLEGLLTADVSADIDGTFEGEGSSGELDFTGTSGEVRFSGTLWCWGGSLDTGTGQIVVDSPGPALLDVPQGFSALVDVQAGDTVTLLNSALVIGGGLIVNSGTLNFAGDIVLTLPSLVVESPGRIDLQGNRLALPSAPMVTVRGELVVRPSGELALDGSDVSIESGGLLRVVGNESDAAAVTAGAGTHPTNRYSLTVGTLGTAATLEARHFLFEGMAASGIVVETSASLGAPPLDLRKGVFDKVAPGSVMTPSVLLDLKRSGDTELSGLVFRDTPQLIGMSLLQVGLTDPDAFNVRSPATGALVLSDWGGVFGGPDFEDDTLDTDVYWGASLSFFVVVERPTQNILLWRTSEESTELAQYTVERKPLGMGSFTQLPFSPVTPTGPGLIYQHADLPGSGVYRLSEELIGGLIHELALVSVDGVPNPPALPGSDITPPFIPLTGSTGPRPGKHAQPDIQELFEDGGKFRLELPAGRHEAFDITGGRARTIHVSGAEGSVVDVSLAPIRVRGLEPGESVVLEGLVLGGPSSADRALEIEDCRGVVLLRDLTVLGMASVLVRESAAVDVVDLTTGGDLLLFDGSRVTATDSAVRSVSVAHGARLGAWNLEGRVFTAADGDWIVHDGSRPRLTVRPGSENLELAWAEAPRGASWVLCSSTRLRSPDPESSEWLLLDGRGPGSLSGPYSFGGRPLSPRATSVLPGEGPIYVQAMVYAPGTEPVATPVLALGSRD